MLPRAYGNGQTPIIKLMQDLGYRSNEGGVCAGVAIMFVAAHLGQLRNEFIEDIRLIYTNPLLAEKIQKQRQIIANNSKTRAHSHALTYEQKHLFNVLSLLEGIELSQQPQYYAPLFAETITQTAYEQISAVTLSEQLQKNGSLQKVDAWAGIYTRADLNYFLLALDDAARQNTTPLAFTFDNTIHKIALCYDHPTRMWFLCDANQLPPHPCPLGKLTELVGPLFHALMEDRPGKLGEVTGFMTTAYALGEQQPIIKKIIQAMRKSLPFEIAHTVNKTRMLYQTQLGITWAHMLAYVGNAELLNLLITAGVDMNKKTITGFTPAHLAAFVGNANIMMRLAAAGADLNAKTHGGFTVDNIAAQFNQITVLQVLHAANIHINQTCTLGLTSLELASQYNNLAAFKFIAETSNANLNSPDPDGHTLLHTAVMLDYPEMVRLLIDKKVDLNKSTVDGSTPISIAIVNNNAAILKMLVEAGADIKYASNNGVTPLQLAEFKKHPDVINLLKKGASVKRLEGRGLFGLFKLANPLPPPLLPQPRQD